jgi:hypothetical protein
MKFPETIQISIIGVPTRFDFVDHTNLEGTKANYMGYDWEAGEYVTIELSHREACRNA